MHLWLYDSIIYIYMQARASNMSIYVHVYMWFNDINFQIIHDKQTSKLPKASTSYITVLIVSNKRNDYNYI